TGGSTGTWLIDPNDYTIAASGGDATGEEVSGWLNTSNVTISTTTMGHSGADTHGDIFVNDALSWTTANTLTLRAERNINISADITATSGGLNLGAGTTGFITDTAGINVGIYTLASGTWNQVGPTLPSFVANDFRITGGTFIRAQGGDGSVGNAYEIADIYGLQGIASSGMQDKNYQLAANIDATSTSAWNSRAGFAPIGYYISSKNNRMFTGTFDGLGHTITGLTINRGGTNYIGLFGYVSSGARISNVVLDSINIRGRDFVGGLVGQNSGTITNCFVIGTSAVNGGYSGGLVGFNTGTISDCSFTGTSVTGNSAVGGFVGYNTGTIINCTVTGTSVIGSQDVSGFVGYNTGTITNCSSTGTSVTGTDYIGGLVGSNGGNVRDSFIADVTVKGSGCVGGLVGVNSGVITNSHYDISSVTIKNSNDIKTSGITIGVLYPEQYKDWMDHGKSLDIGHYFTKDGDYYLLSSVNDLKNLLGFADVSGLKFRLANDINLTDYPDLHIPYFSAKEFDGAGKVVSNLSISNLRNVFTGFFDEVRNANIHDLHLDNVNVNGDFCIGGLVGINYGTITNCSSGGSVGRNTQTRYGTYSGGLVGNNYGTITNCYSIGSVTAEADAGGLVGQNNGTISNCYSTASASYGYQTGGLVGRNYGNITNCYSTGLVTADVGKGSRHVSGLVGVSEGTVTNSYWDKETSGQSSSSGGTGLTTAEMKKKNNFVGWDMADTGGSNAVWRIYEGETYPLLRSFLTPLTITANNPVKTYDGQPYTYGVADGVPSYPTSDSHLFGELVCMYGHQDKVHAGSYPNAITLSGLYSDQQGYDIIYAGGTLTIDPRLLTVGLNNMNVTKVYDGNDGAPSDFSPIWSLTGFLAGDTSADLKYGSAKYNSSHVGEANTLSLSGVEIIGVTGTNGSLSSDYQLVTIGNEPGTTIATGATIGPREVGLVAEKEYDGSTGLTGHVVFSNLVGEEDLRYTDATSNDPHVLTGRYVKTITLADGDRGFASDYALPDLTATSEANMVTISPREVGLVAEKEYDGSTGLTGHVVFRNLVGEEDLRYTDATSNDPHVLTGRYVKTITLADGDRGFASDYALPDLTAASEANKVTINPREVGLVAEKGYDGSTGLTGHVVFRNLVGEEDLRYSEATSNDAHVLTGRYVKTITLADGASGLASDYKLPALDSASDANRVTINPREVGLVAEKGYDGTTGLTGHVVFRNLVGEEDLRYSDATSNDPHVLTGRYVKTITLADGDRGFASDYRLPAVDAASEANKVTINPREVGLVAEKEYDGSTGLTGHVVFSSLVGEEDMRYTDATSNDSHVLTGRYVKTITLADGDRGFASDYALPDLTAASDSNMVTINPREVGLVAEKGYDGTTGLTGHVVFRNIVGEEDLRYTDASSNDPHVLTGRYVKTITLADGDRGFASDYRLPDLTAATVNNTVTINPKVIHLDGSKYYDGNTRFVASDFGDHGVVDGIGAEKLILTGTGTVASRTDLDVRQALSIGDLRLTDGHNGGMGADYTLAGGTHYGTIKSIEFPDVANMTRQVDGRMMSEVLFINTAFESRRGHVLSTEPPPPVVVMAGYTAPNDEEQ
ncbi:MAG: hypothetical protein HGB00_06895, partial [Chlorobiaceae bacterium]|nr:hypothetical protein [Chlorobiaceae bacterium]